MSRCLNVIACSGASCGTADLYGQLLVLLKQDPLPRQVHLLLAPQRCMGQCLRGPNLLVRDQEPVLYQFVGGAALLRIYREHLCLGRVVRDLERLQPPVSAADRKGVGA